MCVCVCLYVYNLFIYHLIPKFSQLMNYIWNADLSNWYW